ncbi:unnamed protein product, partial [Ceratitis capitata]
KLVACHSSMQHQHISSVATHARIKHNRRETRAAQITQRGHGGGARDGHGRKDKIGAATH